VAAGVTLGAPALVRAQTAEVTIGVIYPLSGASAQVGVDAKHAFETALDVINTAKDLDLPAAKAAGLPGLGGAKIRLIFADHQADPQKGRAEAERLITQDKVSAIVGAFHSSVSATVSQTCERYEVPYVAADSSSPSLHRRNLKYFFRPAAHDEFFTAASTCRRKLARRSKLSRCSSKTRSLARTRRTCSANSPPTVATRSSPISSTRRTRRR
jgi:branched-chain amino acid transport system substrate-binding protein